MNVQARFYVREVTHTAWGGTKPVGQVKLSPSTKGPENKSWAQATPAGEISLTINSGALEWFAERLGKDVAITFADRPEEEAPIQ